MVLEGISAQVKYTTTVTGAEWLKKKGRLEQIGNQIKGNHIRINVTKEHTSIRSSVGRQSYRAQDVCNRHGWGLAVAAAHEPRSMQYPLIAFIRNSYRV